MVQNHLKRQKWEEVLFCVAVFAAMLVFFTVLHPIPIMDEDDVIYTVLVRKAIPLPGSWNPSRMMPEVLMSLVGNLSGLSTALGFGRFIDCQVFILAAFFSAFITAYVYALFRLLEKRFACGRFQALCLSVFFLELHFLIFRTELTRNNFMFHTYDACCVFYYTVPALLGCTLVMHFMRTPDETPVLNGKHLIRESFLILALYFEIFSNLFGSVILAAYAGYRVLRGLLRNKSRKNEKSFLRENGFWAGIILLWILAAVFELTGGRAAGARSEAAAGSLGLAAKFGQAFLLFGETMWNSNLVFRLMIPAVTLIVVLLMAARKFRTQNKAVFSVVLEIAVWGMATAMAVLLLCAGAEPLYAGRPEAIFPVVFAIFLLLVLGIHYILLCIPFLARLLPVLLIAVYSFTNTRYLTFQDSNPLLVDGHVAVAIENEIYEAVIEAGKAGETEIWVDVIHTSEDGNWPFDGKVCDPIAKFFLKFGIVDHEMRVHVHASDEMNEKYHIPLP